MSGIWRRSWCLLTKNFITWKLIPFQLIFVFATLIQSYLLFQFIFLSLLNEFFGILKCRIFDDLTESSHVRNYVMAIHPSWTPRSWTGMNFSRQTTCFYHQIALGRGKFGDRYKYSKKKRSCNPNCKFGCDVISSGSSLFFFDG